MNKLDRLEKINLSLNNFLSGIVFFAICLCLSCEKDKVDQTPEDIDFSKNFIEHSRANSFWEYTTTQNGDTLTSSPANVFKQAKDSIINGNPYKVFALVQNDGTQLPFFGCRFKPTTKWSVGGTNQHYFQTNIFNRFSRFKLSGFW